VTVAAVILFASIEGALTDAAGRPAARRTVESAWAGGATPIVVVAPDVDGHVAAALAGSPAVLAEPAPDEAGPVGQVVRGIAIAAERVTETDAVLIWPGRMVWVDAETITSLIEAHGADRLSILRPSYAGSPGWPALLPMEHRALLAGTSPTAMPDGLLEELAATLGGARLIETGDPGATHDRATALDDLPPFEGPPEPVAGPPPEWGSAAADEPDEGPLTGPALAPYGQAAADPD
jgi:CTP:molybdopterin cytidylyltransferase MocA